jgi:hypothetical protein
MFNSLNLNIIICTVQDHINEEINIIYTKVGLAVSIVRKNVRTILELIVCFINNKK